MTASDCRQLSSPGDAVVLQLIPPFDDEAERHIVRAVASVFDELAPVVRPIAADLILTCRGEREPFLTRGEEPTPGAFQLREAEPPPQVEPLIEAATDPEFLVTPVPELDAASVERWMERSIGQSTAPPGLSVTLDVVRVQFSRARIYGIERPAAPDFRLRWYDDVLEVPIERKNEQAWVSAPVGQMNMLPAVAFEVVNYDGALRVTVWAGWSFWAERGHPEHDALQRALRRLVARGFTPEYAALAFDLEARPHRGGPER